jgi:7-keto-8-aminopelargonate synthetase-like enzyme
VIKRHKARILVDDAHAFGVMGDGGRGTASHFDLTDEVDLIVGTFSKTLSSIGGFVAGDRKVIEFIQHHGRSMLFSAALAPPNVAAAHTALKIMREEPERVDRLRVVAFRMRDELRAMGFKTGPTESAVVPVYTGNEFTTLVIWKSLLEAGVYVNPVISPAVRREHSLLRTSYTANHTDEHIDRALELFRKLGKEHGVIS